MLPIIVLRSVMVEFFFSCFLCFLHLRFCRRSSSNWATEDNWTEPGPLLSHPAHEKGWEKCLNQKGTLSHFALETTKQIWSRHLRPVLSCFVNRAKIWGWKRHRPFSSNQTKRHPVIHWYAKIITIHWVCYKYKKYDMNPSEFFWQLWGGWYFTGVGQGFSPGWIYSSPLGSG